MTGELLDNSGRSQLGQNFKRTVEFQIEAGIPLPISGDDERTGSECEYELGENRLNITDTPVSIARFRQHTSPFSLHSSRDNTQIPVTRYVWGLDLASTEPHKDEVQELGAVELGVELEVTITDFEKTMLGAKLVLLTEGESRSAYYPESRLAIGDVLSKLSLVELEPRYAPTDLRVPEQSADYEPVL